MKIENLSPKIKHLIAAAALLFICVGTYSNSLHNDFMMDDFGLILQDKKFHNLDFIFYQFVPDKSRALGIEGLASEVYYRPIQNVFLMLLYHFFQNSVFYYHVTNLLLFFLCNLSIYFLIFCLFNNYFLSFLTGLLYVAHPINGLYVNYITANVFALQVSAMAWSIVLFLQALDRKKTTLYFFSIFLYIVSFLCHETALILPVYMLAVLWTLKRTTLLESIKRCSGYFVISAAYFFLRLHFASLKGSILDKFAQFNVTFYEYLASLMKLMFWYAAKLFSLQGIVMIWTTAPVRDGWFWWIFLWLAVILIYIFILINRKKWPTLAWSSSWMLIGFAPVSLGCLLDPKSGFYIEPHWLYFSSIGIFALTAYTLISFKSRINRVLYFSSLGFLVVVLIISSRQYNLLWRNERTYSEYWHKESPRLNFIMFYVAKAHSDQGEIELAREYYHRAIDDRFPDWQIYTNLGLIDLKDEKFEDALGNFHKALTIYPQSAVINNNLGIAYGRQGDEDKALEYYEKASELNRFYLEPRLNMAKIYKKRGEWQKAENLYHENLTIDPKDKNTLLELLSLYSGQGKVDAALNLYEKVLKIYPKEKQLYQELGKLLGNLEDYDGAIRIWQEGQKIDPKDPTFRELIERAQELKKQPVP